MSVAISDFLAKRTEAGFPRSKWMKPTGSQTVAGSDKMDNAKNLDARNRPAPHEDLLDPMTPEGEATEKQAIAARCPQHRSGTVLNPVAFDSLTESSDELWIELGGQLYRLRKTKQGKLILTK